MQKANPKSTVAPKVHLLNLGWFIVYSGIAQMQVYQVDCGDLIRCSWDCWERLPFLFFVRTSPGVQLWIWPQGCGSLRPEGGRGTECGASLQWQRPAWCCTSLRRAVRSPGEVVPGSRDPASGGLHQLPGGAVWRVTCARTQASWWLQQQP